ncbi:hypothetical protein JW978_01380, partial [Candidatus Dojkabacteria bacterium]|nr:hypothetical protein [Candidatus Dojkabacteria bacterium]
PKLVGTAEAGSTVYVQIGTKLYSTAVGDDGSWELIPEEIETGEYEVQMWVEDEAGNTSTKLDFILVIDPTGGLFPDWLKEKLGILTLDGLSSDEELGEIGVSEEAVLYDLRVRVVNEKNKKSVEGAEVTINGQEGKKTDQEGKALYEDLIRGEYEVAVSYRSHEAIKTVDLTRDTEVEIEIATSRSIVSVLVPVTATSFLVAMGGILLFFGFIKKRNDRNLEKAVKVL